MSDRKLTVSIISSDLDERRGHWRIGQEIDDGSGQPARHLHLIPQRAVVEHAAEFGLDPADSRTVIGWLLHERFVTHPDPSDVGPRCPYRNPPAAAWSAHQADLAEVKTRVSIEDPDGHLEKIHATHTAHPDHVAAARARVAADRAHVALLHSTRNSAL